MNENIKIVTSRSSFAFIVGTTSLAFVISSLDISIVNIGLPQISLSLSASVSELQWIVDAYTIAFASFMLSAGGMGDLLGSKRLFQFGLLIFGVASLGCGVSWNVISLIEFRVLQGIGAATMLPTSLSILNQTFAYDKTLRSKAVSFWTAAGASAIAAGPVIGGILIHVSNWRMIFFVNVPICIIGILCSFRLEESGKRKKKGFDLIGQFIWMFTLTTLISVIIEFHELTYHNPLIYGGLFFSVIAFLFFLHIERKSNSPILPLNMFKSSSFNALILLGTILNGTYYGTVFVLSLYLQNVLNYSPLSAGFAFIPLTSSFVISTLISGKLMSKYNIRIPILYGVVICAVGFLLLIIAKNDTPYWQLFFPFMMIPLGMGLAVPAMTTGILASVDKTYSGTASAVLNTLRQAGGAIGVALFGSMANGGLNNIVSAIAIIAITSSALLLATDFLMFKKLTDY